MVGDESLTDTAIEGSKGISIGDTNTLKTTVPDGSIWYVDKAIVDGNEPIRASIIVDENNVSPVVSEFWRSLTASDRVLSVAPSPDGSTVYLGSQDNNAYAVDASDGTQIWSSSVASNSVWSVAPSPDGSTVYLGSRDNNAYALVETPLASGGRNVESVGTGELDAYAYGGDTIAVGVNLPSEDVGFRLGIREVVN
jgi:outer membrane protein assembly factor BamB